MSATDESTQTIEAVYENGVFRPLVMPKEPLEEGQHVQVHIPTRRRISPREMTKLAARVYDGLSEEEIDEIERIALDRTHFRMPKDRTSE